MVTTVLAIAACSHLPVYSHYEHLESDGWDCRDSITFTANVSDSAVYQLNLGLRANNSFPFTQLTLVAHCYSAVSHVDRTDTITLNITDSEGNMKGKGTTVFHYDALLPDMLLFAQDTLYVTVSHVMTRHLLPGITDVGLTVESVR